MPRLKFHSALGLTARVLVTRPWLILTAVAQPKIRQWLWIRLTLMGPYHDDWATGIETDLQMPFAENKKHRKPDVRLKMD